MLLRARRRMTRLHAVNKGMCTAEAQGVKEMKQGDDNFSLIDAKQGGSTDVSNSQRHIQRQPWPSRVPRCARRGRRGVDPGSAGRARSPLFSLPSVHLRFIHLSICKRCLDMCHWIGGDRAERQASAAVTGSFRVDKRGMNGTQCTLDSLEMDLKSCILEWRVLQWCKKKREKNVYSQFQTWIFNFEHGNREMLFLYLQEKKP